MGGVYHRFHQHAVAGGRTPRGTVEIRTRGTPMGVMAVQAGTFFTRPRGIISVAWKEVVSVATGTMGGRLEPCVFVREALRAFIPIGLRGKVMVSA